MYEDRGKMKWNPFATAELASAHREYHSKFEFRELDFSLEQDEIKMMLSFALEMQLDIKIELTDEKIVVGNMHLWKNETLFVFKESSGHYLEIETKNIKGLSDDMYFDSYIKK